jgi:TRAP-type uncharacterized transport system substrate-binding protein
MGILDLIPWKKFSKQFFDFLVYKQDGRRRDRALIFVVSLALSLGVYFVAADVYFPSRNVLKWAWAWIGDGYEFQSGSSTGTYFKIGNRLAEEAEDDESVLANHANSGGSREVLRKVVRGPLAFGLVQGDFLLRQDFPRNRIQTIGPLYDEKLHILYRLSLWDEVPHEMDGEKPQAPVLALESDSFTRHLFAHARVRLASKKRGPGRPTITQQVVDLCGLRLGENRPLQFTDLWPALEEPPNEKKAIDIAFITIGAPADSIRNIIDKPSDQREFGLVEVEPSVLRALNEVSAGQYHLAGFGNVYGDAFSTIDTVSTRAVLIASREVRGSEIGKVVDWINELTEPEELDETLKTLLGDYDLTLMAEQYPSELRDEIETWAAGLIAICLMVFVFGSLLGGALSYWKQVWYVREITAIYSKNLPVTAHLDDESSDLPLPVVQFLTEKTVEPKAAVKQIVCGISTLLRLAMTIRADYDTGGITVSHQRYLLDSIYQIKSIFQTHLTRRLHQWISTGDPVPPDVVERCYQAAYLNGESYRVLSRLIANRSTPGSFPGSG